MSSVFSKNKEKRSRTSPNEQNNSFVRNVTSRVSGLLPITITKWFSSPNSSNSNGSAPVAESTDSSTEDEATEIMQPPAKRMRLNTPTKLKNYESGELSGVNNIDTIEACTSNNTMQSPPGRTIFRKEPNFASTPMWPPDKGINIVNNKTDSIIVERESTISERDTSILDTNKTSDTISSLGISTFRKRKSLFGSDSMLTNNTTVKPGDQDTSESSRDFKQPSFKPNLLGSPFCPGQTMCGGASTYINQPNIKQRTTPVVNRTSNNDNNVISHSARRVMDLLEQYSSPLSEARRIPQYIRLPKNNDTNNTTERSSASNKIPMTQELYVPSYASILCMKKRSRLMDTTSAVRQLIASHSSASDNSPYPSINVNRIPDDNDPTKGNKLTTKVKSKITRLKRGEINEFETQSAVNLPTGLLQIDHNNLPKFDFDIPNASKVNSAAEVLETQLSTSSPIKMSETIFSFGENSFKFSNPKIISDSPTNPKSPAKFIFGSPERTLEKPKENEHNSVKALVNETKKDWQCSDCWVFNKQNVEKCICCGGNRNSSDQQKKPSICTICKLATCQSNSDSCINCERVKPKDTEETNIQNVVVPSALSKQAGKDSKWKCDDCWVSNDENIEKCIACGGKKPTSISKSSGAYVAIDQNINSTADADWKCNDCWIKNKPEIDKCAACGGAKPGGSKTASTNIIQMKSNTSGFKNLLKSQSDKWECVNCLVRNDNNKIKCACCESEKPGAAKTENKSFNFGTNTNTTFKFGINPNAQETIVSQSAESNLSPDVTKTKPAESETNNNVLTKPPTFTFGLPQKKSEDQIDLTKEKEKVSDTASSKPTFSFGLPKQSQASSNSAIFGILSSPPVTSLAPVENKETPQVVPKVDLTPADPQTVVKTSVNAVDGSLVNDSPKSFNTSLPAPSTTVSGATNKSTDNTLFLKPQDKSAVTLNFSGSSIKPSANMFGGSTSTISSTGVSFSQPAQSVPTTTMLPIFPKSDTPTSSLTVFQKDTEKTSSFPTNISTAATTTSAPVDAVSVTAAPMFSFGSKSAQSQPDKPKFNFTFGSSTKNESTLYPSPFGASNDGKPNTSQFTLPAGDVLTASNTLTATKPLGNMNGLPGTNLSSGNTIGNSNNIGAGSGLPNNTLLPSNGLPGVNSLPAGTAQPAAGGIFGAPLAQKENTMWPANSNTSNIFVSNASGSNLQKPAAFSFGSANFNATFGNSMTNQQPPNVFGMTNQNSNNAPSLFSSTVQSTPTANIFGSAQPANNNAQSIGVFGTSNVSSAPAFGSSTQTTNLPMPAFEVPALGSAFNFGASPSTAVFGFGQSQALKRPACEACCCRAVAVDARSIAATCGALSQSYGALLNLLSRTPVNTWRRREHQRRPRCRAATW